MEINTTSDSKQFQSQCLELINRLVPLTSSAFFLVNPDMQHSGSVLYNLKPDVEREYRTEYGALDLSDKTG
jgi:hypothetical protein